MSDRQLPENFGAKLLRQDEFLHSERYKENRMQLEQRRPRRSRENGLRSQLWSAP